MDLFEKWLTIEELATYLKLSRTKLYGMAQRCEIPASKIGNQWRFDREEVDDWVKRQRPLGSNQKKEGATQ
jgi:excisionase family DNA binding protein